VTISDSEDYFRRAGGLTVVDGKAVRADLVAWRRREIARLRGEATVDRGALETEAAKLRARLAEIEGLLSA
jgi:hypothetical protein